MWSPPSTPGPRHALARAASAGWSPADLGRLVDRTLGRPHRPVLDRALEDQRLRDLASGLGLLALLEGPLEAAGDGGD